MVRPYCAQMTHGSPSPKKILTELEPVTLPTAESAYSEPWAAVTEAKVSGTDVPKATKVIAVIAGGILRTQPKSSATSPTIAVIAPTIPRAIQNAGQPPPDLTGGINEKKIFHVIKRKCMIASPNVGDVIIRSSSSRDGPSIQAFLNCYPHEGSYCSKKYSNKAFSLMISLLPSPCYKIVTIHTFLDEIFKPSGFGSERTILNNFSAFSSDFSPSNSPWS